MKTKYILALVTVVTIASVKAQQLPLYSQYYYNRFLYNPAFVGTGEKANAFLVHRSQWKDMPGAPVTYALTLDGPVGKNIGLGFSMYSDQTDMIHRNGMAGAYSYKIQLTGDHYLYPGVSMGISDNRFDFSRANVHDANDPMLLAQNRRKITFDGSFGLAYIWNDLKVGFSIPQLFGNKVTFSDQNQDVVYMRLTRHFLTSVQYDIAINDDFKCMPSVMARYSKGSPFQLDVNAMVSWKDMIRGGISYRLGYAVGFSAGFQYNNLMAGYTYDMAINSYKTYTGGGHEIMLGYAFGGGGSADDSRIKDMERKLEQAQITNDSLLNTLKTKNVDQDKEINDLKNKLNNLNTNSPGSNDVKKDSTNTGNNTETPEEKNKNIRSEKLADYTDEDGKAIEQGYYVVVESFKSVVNARNNKKFYEDQKGVKVKTIYNKVRKFYYNSVLYTSDQESAIDILEEVKKEKPDAWIFELME